MTRAAELRRNATHAERRLWRALILHLPQRRWRFQMPIGRYIADIAEVDARLVIEVDGGQHGLPDVRRRDCWRTFMLWLRGYRVIRFWNTEVHDNLDGVLEAIRHALEN